MPARLVKHDDGLALLLDPDMLAQLGIDENTPLETRPTGRGFTTLPLADNTGGMESGLDHEFQAALERVNREWGPTLRRLA